MAILWIPLLEAIQITFPVLQHVTQHLKHQGILNISTKKPHLIIEVVVECAFMLQLLLHSVSTAISISGH